jgi:hypothetical protein
MFLIGSLRDQESRSVCQMHIIQGSLHFKLFGGEIAIEDQPSGELPPTLAIDES